MFLQVGCDVTIKEFLESPVSMMFHDLKQVILLILSSRLSRQAVVHL
jgi:hypothetical protein